MSAHGQARAAPEPGGAALSWVRSEGAEPCPDAAAVRRAVADRLGRDPFGGPAQISIEAVVAREHGAFVARIYAREPDGAAIGSRSLRSEAETCASLAEAAALAIALVIDPDAVQRTSRERAAAAQAATRDAAAQAATRDAAVPTTSPPPAVGSQPVPASPPSEPPTARASEPVAAEGRAAQTAHSGWIDVRALGTAGLLPSGFAPGASLSGYVPVQAAWGARAELAYWPEQETESSDARFGFGLTAGSLAACANLPPGAAISVSLCAGGWLGAIHAVVYELEPTAPGDRAWGALSLAAELHARPVSRLRLSLGAQALAPLSRHRFTVRGREGAVFRQSPVAGSALLGAGVSF